MHIYMCVCLCTYVCKEYDKAVYCHPAYLTSAQSTSCKIPDDDHKLESRLLGKISTTSDRKLIMILMAESEEELKKPLDESERGE